MTTTAPEPTKADTLPSGRVVAIAGPVIDVEFPPHALPEINGAVEVDVTLEGKKDLIVAEVAQQIGDGRVRCICLKATDGLTRGAEVRNLGRGLQVPVGDAVLGHVFNVLGQPLDTDSIGEAEDYWQIHRPAPAFDTLEPRAVMFETGIKVIDLLEPYVQGEDRPVRRGRRGQDRAHPGDDQPGGHQPRRCVGLRRGGGAHP